MGVFDDYVEVGIQEKLYNGEWQNMQRRKAKEKLHDKEWIKWKTEKIYRKWMDYNRL